VPQRVRFPILPVRTGHMAFTIPRLTPGGLLSVRLSPASPGAFPQIRIRFSRPPTTASRLRCFPLYAALPRSSGGALLPRVLPPIRHLAYAGFWSLLGAFPSRALPISGFVPARASEGSARVSPSLLPALLGIPCKVSRVLSDGLSNVG